MGCNVIILVVTSFVFVKFTCIFINVAMCDLVHNVETI